MMKRRVEHTDTTVAPRAKEYLLYGSGRLGTAYADNAHGGAPVSGALYRRVVGKKQYEVSDHLGNVRATVGDVKVRSGSTFAARVESFTEYFAFGMEAKSGGSGGRFGFNGMEKDNEVKGGGNHVDFGARWYDTRIARWGSMDPLFGIRADHSPYMFAADNPVLYIDKEGKHFAVAIDHNPKAPTITIYLDIFTFSDEGKRQVENAAKIWNETKYYYRDEYKGEYTDYAVVFKVKAISFDDLGFDLEKLGYNQANEIDDYALRSQIDQLKDDQKSKIKYFVEHSILNSFPVNYYYGINGPHSKGVNVWSLEYQKKEFLLMSHFMGMISSNFDESKTEDIANRADLLAHELGHAMGLDDKGGPYFPGRGAMEYPGGRSKVLGPSQNDINMIMKYIKQSFKQNLLKDIPIDSEGGTHKAFIKVIEPETETDQTPSESPTAPADSDPGR